MRTRMTLLFAVSFLLYAAELAYGENVSYTKVRWSGVSANVVYVNMASPNVRVTPALAKNGTGTSETFGAMVERLNPTAAITGTFFCTRSYRPTGDIVIEGKLVHSGSVGVALCVTDQGRVDFKSMREGRTSDWAGCRTVLCTGPTLVRNGKPSVAPKSEGFRDPEIFRRKPRTAVGMTDSNKLILVTTSTPVYLSELAKVMRHLGAVDALNLDGGSSTALYYRGSTIVRPARSMTNLLVVYETPKLYASYRSQLAPNMPRTTVASRPAADPADDLLERLFAARPRRILPYPWQMPAAVSLGGAGATVITSRGSILN
ncbi:MAG: phosphodiester glycosidase family protein [Armatimonadetes bacterium]|nr:phosphodiester glycosidase family protein [Armatimonadota bacterium]